MTATAQNYDPTTISQLVSKLDTAFEKGCGPLSDEVKRLVDASRRIDGGYECARGMLRARFGPAADARATPGSWPRLLMALMTLLLVGITSAVGIIAWIAWTTGPKIDRVIASLNTPADMEFVAYTDKVEVGTLARPAPTIKVYDNLHAPVADVEVEFTIETLPIPAPGAAPPPVPNIDAAPATAYIVRTDTAARLKIAIDPALNVSGNVLDFGAGFIPAELASKKIPITAIGRQSLTQRTLADGQATLPDLLIGTTPGEFQITAKVKNNVVSFKRSIKITAIAGKPKDLSFAGSVTPGAMGAALGTIVVNAKDRFSNPAVGSVALAVSSGPPAAGVDLKNVKLSADPTKLTIENEKRAVIKIINGTATFETLKITPIGPGYKLKATAADNDNVTSPESLPFDVI